MNRYYPIVICALFSLIGGLRIDMWLGLAAGYLMDRFIIIDHKCTPSINLIKKTENLLLRFHTVGKFTTFSEIANGTTQPGSVGGQAQQHQAPAQNFQQFGGRGVTVGADQTSGMFPEQNAYDEIQKQHNEANQVEKVRQAAIKRDNEMRAAKK